VPAAGIHQQQVFEPEIRDPALTCDRSAQQGIMHQHQTIAPNGHYIKFNRMKTMSNCAAQPSQRVLGRENSTAPMSQYPGIVPHRPFSCHHALGCLL
jgi:hypothetical protein